MTDTTAANTVPPTTRLTEALQAESDPRSLVGFGQGADMRLHQPNWLPAVSLSSHYDHQCGRYASEWPALVLKSNRPLLS